MKNLIFIILSFYIVIFVGQRILLSPCDRPIRYRVDTVDVKFNLAKDKFIEDSKKAGDIWNKAYGKSLLVYDPQGNLSINLIYDQRQLLNSQINKLQGQIYNEKGTLDPQIIEYQKGVASFNAKLADLNNQIETWNQRGGAPPDVYNQLIQEQKDLQLEADTLNATAINLNLTTQNFNAQVGKLNQTVDTFNEAIEQRPEEGIYIADQNRIEVYFYITQNELIHTIAHEMGHGLDLEHTTNPKSIMYSKTNQIIIPAKEDLDQLKTICAKKNLFDIILSRLKLVNVNLFLGFDYHLKLIG